MGVKKQNNLQPHKRTDDVFVDGHSASAETNGGYKNNKNHLKLRFAVGFGILILLIFTVVHVISNRPIHIGQTKITNSNIDEYADQLKAYQKAHPGTYFSSNLHEYAKNALIMNAALIKEAQTYDIKISDSDLLPAAIAQSADESTLSQFISNIHSKNQKILLINLQNKAYQAKLQDKLLAKKKLLMLNLVLASPYYENLPKSQLDTEYKAAQTRLSKDYMPAVNSNASAESIVNVADLDWSQDPVKNSKSEKSMADSLGMFSDGSVVAAEIINDYKKGDIQFSHTNQKSYSWARPVLGKIYNPEDKIDQLSKVGQNTGVFTGTNGGLVVVRLDKLSGGKYANWGDFLNSYKNHIGGKTSTGNSHLNGSVYKNVNFDLFGMLLSAISGHASAAQSDDTCLSNIINTAVIATDDISGGFIAGAKLNVYRDPSSSFTRTDKTPSVTYTPSNSCGSSGNNYAVSSNSGSPTFGAWSRGGENTLDNTFHDSCWNVPPVFYVVKDPNNYKPVNNSLGNNASWGNQQYDGTGSLPTNYKGFPDPPNADYGSYEDPGSSGIHTEAWHMRPGLGNTRTYFIYLHYIPDWNLAGTTNITDTSIALGQVTTFKHTVEQSGAAADYKYYVAGRYQHGASSTDYSDGSGNCKAVNSGASPCDYSKIDIIGGTGKDPDRMAVNYTFPSSAVAGDQYCQRIYFTYPHGPGDSGPGYSPERCVTYTPLADLTHTQTCSSIAARNDGNELVLSSTYNRYGETNVLAAKEAPHAVASGASYQSRTHITVTGISSNLSDVIGYGHSHDYNKPITPTGTTVHVVFQNTAVYLKAPGPDGTREVATSVPEYIISTDSYDLNCMDAAINLGPSGACSTTMSITGEGPGNVVKVNGRVYLNATIYNTGAADLPDSINGHRLSLTYGSDALGTKNPTGSDPAGADYGDFAQPIGGLAVGEHRTIIFELPNKAPNSAAYQAIWAHIAYPTVAAIGAACWGPADVYEPFSITLQPTAVLNPDTENPNSFEYGAKLCNSALHPVNVGTALTAKKVGTISDIYNNSEPTSSTYASGGCTNLHYPTPNPASSTVTNPAASDSFCTKIDATWTTGYVGGRGPDDLIDKGSDAAHPTSVSACATVHDEPYAHFVGSDVFAGGAFEGLGDCSNSGTIKGYQKNDGGNTFGSGSQFGAIGIGDINGFNSLNLLNLTSPKQLTFGNTNFDASLSAHDAHMGGNLGGQRCLPDYFAQKTKYGAVYTDASAGPVSASSDPNPVVYYSNTATKTITGGTIVSGSKVIYVNGDVKITGNITYDTSSPWADPAHIPSLYIIAKGNIMIDPSVTRLDGVYVAEPNGANGGTIDTCDHPIADVGPGATSFFNSCRRQLKVYGAFLADKILLNRTHSSLRHAQSGESVFDPGAHDCTDATKSDIDYPFEPVQANDCAAEVFYFSPEIYLAPNGLPVQTGIGTGKYDSFTSLSPTL